MQISGFLIFLKHKESIPKTPVNYNIGIQSQTGKEMIINGKT